MVNCQDPARRVSWIPRRKQISLRIAGQLRQQNAGPIGVNTHLHSQRTIEQPDFRHSRVALARTLLSFKEKASKSHPKCGDGQFIRSHAVNARQVCQKRAAARPHPQQLTQTPQYILTHTVSVLESICKSVHIQLPFHKKCNRSHIKTNPSSR